MLYPLTYCPFGEQAILINWPDQIDPKISSDIRGFEACIDRVFSSEIRETVMAYNSLTLYLNVAVGVSEFIVQLKELYAKNDLPVKQESNLWRIPVCYEPNFGMDLKALAKLKKCSAAQLIKRHTAPLYEVCFLGFLPGFPYLSGLDPSLEAPRLKNPRAYVSRGSVAIGGKQTGIYPVESPGGWHIIGKTPISFFEVENAAPSFLKPGDKLKFVSITKAAYQRIEKLQDTNAYTLEKEVHHD